jgi:hypothetical protein
MCVCVVLCRVEDVQNIEKSLVELSAQFRRLIEIIGQQDELIIRIDEDTTNALANVKVMLWVAIACCCWHQLSSSAFDCWLLPH